MIKLGISITDSMPDLTVLANTMIYDEIEHINLNRDDYLELKPILENFRTEHPKALVTIEQFLSKMDIITQTASYRYWLKDYFQTHHCKIPYGFAVILSDGRVTPCCTSHYICGNAIQTSFDKIWNSDKFCNFRMEAYNLPERKKEATDSCCYACNHFCV